MQRFRQAAFSLRYAVQSASYAQPARKPKSGDKPIDQKTLVSKVAAESQFEDEDVAKVTQTLLNAIVEEVSVGNTIQLRGFGTFKRVETAARAGRNPQTGESLQISASARPGFSAAKGFKDAVKDTYSKRRK